MFYNEDNQKIISYAICAEDNPANNFEWWLECRLETPDYFRWYCIHWDAASPDPQDATKAMGLLSEEDPLAALREEYGDSVRPPNSLEKLLLDLTRLSLEQASKIEELENEIEDLRSDYQRLREEVE